MHSRTCLALMSGLATIASAHMVIDNFKPYNAAKLDNGPLFADGSNFPCKNGPGFDAYGGAPVSNVLSAGSTNKLTFRGSAVHGGGSCQISITRDAKPTKSSVWRVIKSIHGGCPARNTPGNLGDNANAIDPFEYDFTVPEGIAAGNYTIAWTWFNKVGNREMYMNCGPATITGQGGSDGFLDSLPEMYAANIGNGCSTPEGHDISFPNPGDDVEVNAEKLTPAQNCQGGSGKAPAGDAPPSEPERPTKAIDGPTPPKETGKYPGGVFMTVQTSEPAGKATAAPDAPIKEPPTETAAPKKPAAPAPAPKPAPAPAPAPGNNAASGSSFPVGSACSNEGSWNCVDGSTYQRCGSGIWTPVMNLAAGTSCAVGVSENIKISKRGKRSVRVGAKMFL